MKFRHFTCIFLSLMMLAILSGCAASSAAIMDEERVTNTKPISRYHSLRINEFLLKNDLVTSSPPESANEREKRYLTMPQDVAATVERLVSDRQIFTTVSRTVVPDAKTLVLSGVFTRVSRFKVSVTSYLHDGVTGKEVAYFRLTLWDVYDTSKTISVLSKEISDFIDRIQYK